MQATHGHPHLGLTVATHHQAPGRVDRTERPARLREQHQLGRHGSAARPPRRRSARPHDQPTRVRTLRSRPSCGQTQGGSHRLSLGRGRPELTDRPSPAVRNMNRCAVDRRSGGLSPGPWTGWPRACGLSPVRRVAVVRQGPSVRQRLSHRRTGPGSRMSGEPAGHRARA